MPELSRAQRIRILPVARNFTPTNSYVGFASRVIPGSSDPGSTGEWSFFCWLNAAYSGGPIPIEQTGASMEIGVYIDTNNTISIHSSQSPGYHFNTGTSTRLVASRWDCFVALGNASGWGSYTGSSGVYTFNSVGTRVAVNTGGTPSFRLGSRGADARSIQGPIGLTAAWSATLTERECRALGAGAAPWKIRRSHLRFLWSPRTSAGPDFDLIGNRHGTLSGSPTLASFPARGILRP